MLQKCITSAAWLASPHSSGHARLFKGHIAYMELQMVDEVVDLSLPYGGVSKSHCGCRALDFVSSRPCSCDGVRFFNKHTYSISMLYQSSGCSDWKIILWQHVIMPNPHTLGRSSESCVTILADRFLHKVEDLMRLRVMLRQPSPHWDDFGISNFGIVFSPKNGEPTLAKASSLQQLQVQFYEVDLLKTWRLQLWN